jgi:hypothetical protein
VGSDRVESGREEEEGAFLDVRSDEDSDMRRGKGMRAGTRDLQHFLTTNHYKLRSFLFSSSPFQREQVRPTGPALDASPKFVYISSSPVAIEFPSTVPCTNPRPKSPDPPQLSSSSSSSLSMRLSLLLSLSLLPATATSLPFVPRSSVLSRLPPRGGEASNGGGGYGQYGSYDNQPIPTASADGYYDHQYGGADQQYGSGDYGSGDYGVAAQEYGGAAGGAQGLLSLSAVSKTSITGVFFLLMWRSIHHYELADSRSSMRLMFVLPSMLLFLANLVGFLVSFLPNTDSKKNLKHILNANKVIEALLLVGGLFRLIFLKPKRVYGRIIETKDMVVGRVLINAVYIAICQLMTKISVWGIDAAAGGGGFAPIGGSGVGGGMGGEAGGGGDNGYYAQGGQWDHGGGGYDHQSGGSGGYHDDYGAGGDGGERGGDDRRDRW